MKRFLARHPVYTADKEVFGYELLCRNGPENFLQLTDLDVADSTAVDEALLFGLEGITDGRLAFINCSRDFLVKDYLTLLPKEQVVAEILESANYDPPALEACRRLKNAGYRLVLDAFVDVPAAQPFIELADFIKIDCLSTSPHEQNRLAREFKSRNIPLIASKIESLEVFSHARDAGYSFFQGYVFCRPQMLERQDVPAHKLNYLRALRAVNDSEFNLDEVACIVKREASLSYRLLRYLSSPAFDVAAGIRSIPQALSLLGGAGIRKWMSLVSIAATVEDKPRDLMMRPLTRARFCELLAAIAGMGAQKDELFLMGLVSTMDAVLHVPISKLLEGIAVSADIRDPLLGRESPFRSVYEIAVSYETGTWEQVAEAAASLRINEDDIPASFMQASEWARQVMAGSPMPVPAPS